MVFDFFKKEESKEKLNEKDIGFVEDQIPIIAHHIHDELHTKKTYFETGDASWLEISNEHRVDRTELMDDLIKVHEGELWCWSKHVLYIIVGYMELSDRKYSEGKREEAIKYLNKSKKWLGLFMIKNKL